MVDEIKRRNSRLQEKNGMVRKVYTINHLILFFVDLFFYRLLTSPLLWLGMYIMRCIVGIARGYIVQCTLNERSDSLSARLFWVVLSQT